jgi:class 3 adenylate cyclase/tetratricopeptide (TPR) repeat protein
VSQTEHITVLFTDLVGSTALATSLAPEAADEVRNKHFSALRQAIASSGGTEVKNLGDGLMVVFPAASSALGCAVAMQQVVHRDNVRAERPLGLRVGLSSGEATKDGDDYFGDPVIEAARLCAKAGAGQILATDVVKVSAGRRSSHGLTSLGELELKGLPDPVETLEVAWAPLGKDVLSPGRVPLPVRLGHVPGVGVIGRQDELATLEAAAKRVASGDGRKLLFVAGEPGQGKTTLVAEFARRVHEAQMTVLLGRCDEEVGAPYRPFHEALSHLVAHLDETLLRSHVAAYGGELDRMVPALRQRLGEVPAPPSTDADSERYLLYGAVTGLMEVASTDTPVVLVLDDLHWADKPSLQLLRHLVAQSASQRLLIVGTYREAELSSSHPLTEALAALHREPSGVSSIALKGLEDTGVIAFMESAAGHELDQTGIDLAHQVYRETDGNPFFVSEMLRNLVESGAISQDESGRWTAHDTEGRPSLPNSVRTVVGTRVSRLGEQAEKILSTAAVIGRDFDLDVLAETTKLDEDALIDLLEEAHSAALVNELSDAPGRYSFSHALVQHTLYDDLGPTRRTRAHRAVGEAIERLHGSDNDERVGELARHFFLATRPTDADKAISYAQRAGEAALTALAPDEAVRYFSQALELAAHVALDPGVRIDLLIGLGNAQRQVGISEFRTTLLDAAREARDLGDTERLVAAALANNRGYFSSAGVIDADRVEVLEAALEALPDTDSPRRARLLSRLCNELAFGPLERRLALASEAKATARRGADTATLIQVIMDCRISLWIPSLVEDQLAEAQEALALAEGLDDPVTRFWVTDYSAIEAPRAGEFELASRCLMAASEVAQELQQPMLLWTITFVRAMHAVLHGDHSLAEELTTSAIEFGNASGQPDAFTFFGTQLMSIRLQQGRLGEFVSLVASVAEQFPAIPSYKAVLAAAHLDAGDANSASALVEAAAIEGFALPMDLAWFDGVLWYARPVIELHIASAARQLLDLLAPYHQLVPNNSLMCHEPVAMFLGGLATVLELYDDAERYFAEAADLNQRGNMSFAEAHTNLLWGRMLRARNGLGDADRARAVFERARESAASRGYALIERRTVAELSGIG